MVFESIRDLNRYDLQSEKFKIALDFLTRVGLEKLEAGSIVLCDGVIANIQHYDTEPAENLKFESHDYHFDIQYVIEGTEGMGVTTKDGLEALGDYIPENDVRFWKEPKHSGMVVLNPGEYIILGPEDAHKPHCIVDEVSSIKKIVIKVEV